MTLNPPLDPPGGRAWLGSRGSDLISEELDAFLKHDKALTLAEFSAS